MGKKRFRMMWVILSVIVLSAVVGVVFVNMPQFGRLPRGERLARIERSAHYRDGEFRNLHETVLMTSGKGFFQNLTGFLFRKQAGLKPDSTLPVIKTDLQTLNLSEDLLVWFGHSSYLIQMEGKRLLVDPVFCTAAPVSFVNKPFKGTEVYRPEDMPDIDWAILENGQYNEGWKYIHLMPGYMAAVARELKAAKILTVHHSKYALATHPWDEPLKNARRMRDRDSLPVVIPQIGEVVNMTGH